VSQENWTPEPPLDAYIKFNCGLLDMLNPEFDLIRWACSRSSPWRRATSSDAHDVSMLDTQALPDTDERPFDFAWRTLAPFLLHISDAIPSRMATPMGAGRHTPQDCMLAG